MNLSPLPIQKFFANNGRPLNRGLLFTYVAGTTTKIDTYTDSSGGALNTNPVVLNFRGEANVWLDPTLTYKFVLAPEGDTDPPTNPFWTVDNISSGITFASLTAAIVGQILWPRSALEIATTTTPTAYFYPYGDPRRSTLYTNPNWIDFHDVATFISTTSFSIPNDVTTRYPVQRRLQIRDTGSGAVYARITAAVFAASKTTFTVVVDSGNVPNPIAGVLLGQSIMADDPGQCIYDTNYSPGMGPAFWNLNNGAAAISRVSIFAGTSGTGADVGLAIVALSSTYGGFPYIVGAPSGRQVVLHTGVSAPAIFGVFDVAKLALTAGNNPSRFYTDLEVNNNQTGATSSIAAIDCSGTVSRLSLRTSGVERGFVSATNAGPEMLIGSNSAIDISLVYNGARVVTLNGATTTGAATPSFGANKPGVNSAIAEWWPVKNAAGTQRYIALWS